MGYHLTASAAYAGLDPAVMDAGRAEARVFAQATRRLEAAAEAGRKNAALMARAIHENRRLWQATLRACDDDANVLPPELRAALIGLAGFVDRHSSAVLRGEAGPDPLIEINRRVARGLSAGAA